MDPHHNRNPDHVRIQSGFRNSGGEPHIKVEAIFYAGAEGRGKSGVSEASPGHRGLGWLPSELFEGWPAIRIRVRIRVSVRKELFED